MLATPGDIGREVYQARTAIEVRPAAVREQRAGKALR